MSVTLKRDTIDSPETDVPFSQIDDSIHPSIQQDKFPNFYHHDYETSILPKSQRRMHHRHHEAVDQLYARIATCSPFF